MEEVVELDSSLTGDLFSKEKVDSESKPYTLELHNIDMERTDTKNISRELIQELSTIGFLTLINIPGYNEEEYLRACKALHQVPEEKKRQLFLKKDNPKNINVFYGYQPFQANDASHKEFFDQGVPYHKISKEEKKYPLYEETPFLPEKEYEWIQTTFESTRAAWQKAAEKIVKCIAVGLGKDATYFDDWFQGGSLSVLRTIHYLPRSSSGVDSSQLNANDYKLTTPEHADSGFLTFLATFGYPGLQVLIDGKYRDIAPAKNKLVVNVGDLFARITNYRLKATFHRVLDIGRERFSSPLFLEPKYSTSIPLGMLYKEEERGSSSESSDQEILFGDWVIKRIVSSYVEWKDFEIPAQRKQWIDSIDSSQFKN